MLSAIVLDRGQSLATVSTYHKGALIFVPATSLPAADQHRFSLSGISVISQMPLSRNVDGTGYHS